MVYTYKTLTELVTIIANRLDDSENVFWTRSEIARLIREALLTWQSFAQQVVTTEAIDTTGVPVGDLVDIEGDSGSGRALFSVSGDLVDWIREALFETTYTEQFVDLATALPYQTAIALRQWHQSTRLISSTRTVAGTAQPIDLGQDTLGILYAAWKPLGGVRTTVLYPLNEDVQGKFSQGLPYGYRVKSDGETQLRLIPEPRDIGQLYLVTFDNTTRFPLVFSWALKWAILGNLLSNDGQAKDALRAEYCKQRYADAVSVAKGMTVVKTVSVDGNLVPMETLSGISSYNPKWQEATGKTTRVGNVSANHLALTPMKTGQAVLVQHYGWVELPTDDLDNVQIPSFAFDVLVNYVVHLALFKCSGLEWTETLGAYKELVEKAVEYNDYLKPLLPSLSTHRKEKQRKVIEMPSGDTK